jgi:hypothetical protein
VLIARRELGVEAVKATTFLAEARAHRIGVDPKYAKHWPRNLSFGSGHGLCRYWVPPEDPAALSSFIDCILRVLGDWRHVVVWPKCVPFGGVLRGEDVGELTRLADAHPQLDGDGGVRFERSEVAALVELLAALIRHGWSWPTDVFVIPDSFETILMVDHHDAVHAKFASAERCARFVEGMEARGFPLTKERPDETFGWRPDGTA